MNNELENFNNEHWRDIDGYEGMYQVSDFGRVRSRKSGEWKMMKPSKNCRGYMIVGLTKYLKTKSLSVHRLVAQAFIPNDDERKTVINHKNEIKTDNRVENLEWCTQQYNITYNDLNWRRKPFIHPNYKRDKVKDLYDPNLTYAENLEIFRANGIECSEMVIRKLRRELGLTKQYELKQEKIKHLYNPELTINENLNVFMSKGIECCVGTVINLRKELNLEPHPNYKRHKLKDLYRPDLTIKQNIALFKEQGIECSKSTVIKLRKDLGLIK